MKRSSIIDTLASRSDTPKMDSYPAMQSIGHNSSQIQLEDVPIVRGTAYLRPENVTILGGQVEPLECVHRRRLTSDLYNRMIDEISLAQVCLFPNPWMLRNLLRHTPVSRIKECLPPNSSLPTSGFKPQPRPRSKGFYASFVPVVL